MLIGYLLARGTDAGALPEQRQALADAGCGKVVEDGANDGASGQPGLRQLFEELRKGDVVVVPHLGSLGRSLPEVVRWVQRIAVAGAGLRSLSEAIDTTTEAGRAARLLTVFDRASAWMARSLRSLSGSSAAAPTPRSILAP